MVRNVTPALFSRFLGDDRPRPAMSDAVSQSRPDDDDRDLAGAIGGDHTAFAHLYDRHAAVVLSLCRRSGDGSLTEAEDATQETFIRAFGMLDRLNGSITCGGSAGIRAW